MQRAELQPLKDAETGRISWPAIQPKFPRKSEYFLCGKACGCCPPYVLFTPFLGALLYILGLVGLVLVLLAALILYIVLGWCCCSFYNYTQLWRCPPFNWVADLYPKMTFLAYQAVLMSRSTPNTSPEYMPASKITPKQPLDKYSIDYALNIKVPKGWEEEFLDDPIMANKVTQYLEEKLALIPQRDHFEEFAPGEDPVAYVMRQMGSVFPEIYQVWGEKLNDIALTRFCLYGLAAHRVETTTQDGNRYYIVRTNALSNLPVRPGFERYGGDAFFDMNWRPVKIVDNGLGPLIEDGKTHSVTSVPGDAMWEKAKFRFRSSLSVLVTVVDHLYGIHLQLSNITVTAVREQLSADHPLRRFLTPFTYQTIAVNDNARNNLIQPRSMGPRCFAWDDTGLQLAFAAAPGLVLSGLEVSREEGGPYLNRAAYIDYLKNKRGIDTEYFRQSKKYYLIVRKFVVDYLACYYSSPAAVATDPEMQAMFLQLTHQLEYISPSSIFHEPSLKTQDPVEIYNNMVDITANFIFVVTAGHEQVGAIEAYVQDVSFCAFKWTHGSLMGTKQTATAQGLLMSFTSTAMPKLLGSNWVHLFPPQTNKPEPSSLFGAFASAPPETPAAAFAEFQQALQAFSLECDTYNATAPSRSFPECFPMYVMNPKLLETSISV